MEHYFSKQGILADSLSGYEVRPGQQMMAEAVERTLNDGAIFDDLLGPVSGVLVAEAETGIGKTLAYLIPSVLSGKKIVVSTATINLQDQILKKDVPLLQNILPYEIKALCVKGRQNYLCLYRWYQYQSSQQQVLFEGTTVDRIDEWLKTTETGDRAELDWLSDSSNLWNKISSNSTNCLGADCPEFALCFVNQLRKRAAKVQLLIVNHHLLFSDLVLRKGGHGEVLPRYEAVIFDEAHHIENVATNYFGKSISQYQLLDLLKDIEQQAEKDLLPESCDIFLAELGGMRRRIDSFTGIFPPKRGRYPLEDILTELGELWRQEVENLSSALSRMGRKLEKNVMYGDVWNGLAARTYELEKTLCEVALLEENTHTYGYVHWYERRERSVVVSRTPIQIADEIEDTLFRQVSACVLTSATLSTGGNFKYIQQRLGLPDNTEFLQLKSPFDYKNQTRLYIPDSSFPEPSDRAYQSRVCEKILEIVELVEGRTLVLFTSFRGMEAAAEYLEDRLEYPLYVQGSLPRRTLLDKFSKEVDSVLLAVASFWEGVDVPGESLSCVIIDKLPFEVPSDPVFKARVDEIQRTGGKPFFDFQIPRAILSLRQGVGRLMRSSSDQGIIAILDVRLFSKGYGREFRKSLPPAPITRSLESLGQVL